MSTTENLRDKYSYLWDRLFNHPFVVGIGSGELPLEKFQFYVKQDYYFLVQYNRMLALATAKAPDLENIGRFASLLNETLNVEMELHRTFSRKFDVSAEELEATRPAPITLAYTDYLLRVAYEGTLTDVIANLLPCQWGYAETGLHLARTGDATDANPYAEWIQMYSAGGVHVLCRLAAGVSGLPYGGRGRQGDDTAGGALPDGHPLRVPLLGDVLQPGGLAIVGG